MGVVSRPPGALSIQGGGIPIMSSSQPAIRSDQLSVTLFQNVFGRVHSDDVEHQDFEKIWNSVTSVRVRPGDPKG